MAESALGGYDYVFITDLPEDLVCTLCHLAFKNPLQIEECGHTFCKLCFDQMVEHAESNSLDITCPLDRQKIDIARVFKDKSCERRVLNLMVKCPNFEDDCDWTGELREALVHETECCKNITKLTKPLHEKLDHLLNRIVELETNAKTNALKLSEKDRETVSQKKQIEILIKQMDEQNKQMQHQKKLIEDQSKQVDNCVKQMNNPHQCQNNMIIQNIGDDSNYSPINTAFQWKFNPTDIRSGLVKFSPPFYNVMNPNCFQLRVHFLANNFCMTLCRYRGKYDHSSNAVKETKNFVFKVHIFGENCKLKTLVYDDRDDYSFPENRMKSPGWWKEIENGEIDSFTTDGYVNLHCFFK